MNSFVVDTNVAVVANGQNWEVAPLCVLNCVRKLVQLRSESKIVLDEGGQILQEYMRNLNLSGRPGAGDYFMKWVFQNQSVAEHCESVRITPSVAHAKGFEEFPSDDRLTAFDADDRKFVAVALASPSRASILNATDSDWWEFREALAENGVVVEFICPERFEEH